MMNSKKQAYEKILKVLEKNKEIIGDDYYTNSLSQEIVSRIKAQDICDLFSIPDLVTAWGGDYNNYYNGVVYDIYVIYCPKESKTIFWSDDGRQPSEEYLYTIGFPTGAYVFGDFYPEELFQRFFLELKSYNPKYIDTANKQLYFSPDNAKEIHLNLPTIFKKYKDLAGDEYKKIRAKKLKEELKKLEE